MRADRFDLLVAGGGPAGLAVAISARLRGLTVAVLERRRLPVDAACGEGLMPEGARLLDELGVTVPIEARAEIAGIRFIDGELRAEGRFASAPGLGVRRTVLQAALAERAGTLGAELRFGSSVTGLRADGFDTDRGPVCGGIRVGADGRESRVRLWAGLDGPQPRRPRFGVRRHFRVAPWADRVEVHWAGRSEAYVTPVGSALVGVALLGNDLRPGFDHLLERFPSLTERLEGAGAASSDRGAGRFGRRATRVVDGTLALVGDAAGSLDPISGEGVTLAFQDATALVDAVADGRLPEYATTRRRLRRWPRRMAALLVVLAEHPKLRRRVLASLASQPDLMTRFLLLRTMAPDPPLLGRDGFARLTLAAVTGAGGRP